MVTLPTFAVESPRTPWTLAAGLRRAFSFLVLLGVLLFAGSFSLAKNSVLDPDMWWHMAVGQRMLATHALPWSDTYSSTVSGVPWIAYEWLGEVAIGAAASVAGLRSTTFLLVCLSGIFTLLLYYYAALRCGNSKAAFAACAISIPAFSVFFTLRPQLFGAIFLVLTLIVVERFRQGDNRPLWFLPVLFLLWVNTHGSFVFGFLVLAVTWLGGLFEFSSGGIVAERWTKRQSVQLLLAILLSVLALPVTPYGTRLAAYPLSMALSQTVNVTSIQEWLPLGTGLFVGKYFLAVALLFFLALLLDRPRFRLPEVALAMFGAFAACAHVRFLLIFMVFLVPLWAVFFSRWVPAYRSERDHPLVNAILVALLVAGLFAFFPSKRELNRREDAEYPASALRFLANHPVHGRLFNEYGWGGYLIWAGSPRNQIFIDGRADLYEYGGVLADYLSIVRLEPETPKLLQKYGVEACLIRRDAPLATALNGFAGWQRVYADDVASVYVRGPGKGRL